MSNTLKLGNGQWATGKDTILAYNDLNSNYKPLAFSFSRASSATVVNKDGLIETVGSGEPRIDFNDNTKGALLLEPSRTNYQPYSTNFSVWSAADVTLNLNYGLSPDGFNNSVLITEGTGSAQHRIVRGSPSSSGIYTFSCFVRNKVGNRQAYIDMGAVTGFFNFDTKTMYSAAGTTNVESWSNDWYRISITSNSNITPSANYIGTGKNNTETFQGDGSSAIEFFAPQLEVGIYPTSIIPTSGSAVTRVAESTSQTLPDGVIGQTEGTIFYDGYYGDEPSEVYLFLQENLGNGVSDSIYIQKFGSNSIAMQVYDGNNFQTQLSGGSYVSGQRIKIAVAYKQNDFALYINNVQIGVSSGGLVPNLNGIQIGTYPALSDTHNYIASKGVNNVQLYNTRLSNSELAALTQ